MNFFQFTLLLKPPKELKKEYELTALTKNTERLRMVAGFLIICFSVLMIQHLNDSILDRDGVSFRNYFAVYVVFIIFSALYLLFDLFIFRRKGSFTAQFLLVVLILAGTTFLAILDALVSGDLTALFLGLIAVSVLYRCPPQIFILLAFMVASAFLFGMKLYKGSFLVVDTTVSLVLDIVIAILLSLFFRHYDILAFSLEKKWTKALGEKEIILKEVHHRIKNNMNTIYGLLALQAETLKEPGAIAALEDAGSRVKSMMLLYEKLYKNENFEDVPIRSYLNSLIDEIIQTFPNRESIQIEKHIDDFILNVRYLQPLGIIINELLTNIMKYAFTGRESGLITIRATRAERHIAVVIEDNGNGIPESINFKNSSGFGLVLLEGLIEQINGTIHIGRDNGTQVTLEFEA